MYIRVQGISRTTAPSEIVSFVKTVSGPRSLTIATRGSILDVTGVLSPLLKVRVTILFLLFWLIYFASDKRVFLYSIVVV